MRLTCANRRGDGTLHVYNVSVDHFVSAEGSVFFRQQNWGRLACTRNGNDTYIAFTRPELHQVTLHRLEWTPTPSHEAHDLFTGIYVDYPNQILFRGDLLLVNDWNSHNNSQAIVSFRASDGALSEKRVLLASAAKDLIEVAAWDLAGDRLVLWDKNSRDLLIYAFA